ncbi:PH domain-containing protein [Facklamia sp. DSM 111018]|uniref:PH domain-containing protein n=1 Tax=Facklamia lactis TaxID=2749967 RepID=A0ABS0LML0_9LACT|nr:PH domain-containing protein [Facklamia lactis]MBG9979915.1 PH domain-containing protein [Facklamia lactis]MBG9985405.1 PH domain-containing protein [Facklamia lactis]
MSLFDRLLGNAGQIDNQKVESAVKEILADNEKLEISFKLVRDLVIFTNKRLIMVDVQGTGAKKVMQSIPYYSISRFSIETAGINDLDSELKLYIAASSKEVVSLELGRNKENVYKIAKTLANELFA